MGKRVGEGREGREVWGSEDFYGSSSKAWKLGNLEKLGNCEVGKAGMARQLVSGVGVD